NNVYRFDAGKLEMEVGEWKIEDNFVFLPTRIWVLQKIVQRIMSILDASYTGDGKIDKDEGKQIVKNITALIPEERLKSGLNKIDLKYNNFEEEVLKHLMSKSDKNNDHQQALQELLMKVVFAVFVSFFDEFRLVATDIERMIIVSAIDKLWTEHLDAMSILREGISLRSYAQKDPLTEYKNEGFRLFQSMLDDITENIVGRIFKVKVEGDPEKISQILAKKIVGGSKLNVNKLSNEQMKNEKVKNEKNKKESSPTVTPTKVGSSIVASAKVGRNDPCPCGSGKKYKKCCGRKQ
ncbi:MAG TPA: SEC-C metal-binding domain-containing protein, partial [Candidatus Dojkabacteria bacterium]|nr:SEC-C metal-binding domain-containing protein [Candidatus Dojkabacteria bacterium]